MSPWTKGEPQAKGGISQGKLGTTKRGIGPVFGDKMARWGIRIDGGNLLAFVIGMALVVGCAVCTALSTSGAFITDLKVGYWLGASPFEQQRWKFLGMVVAALVVALIIPLMDQAYHFVVEDPETGADSIAIRKRSMFSLGYDHRMVDGADAARFLARLKELMESFPEDA